MPSEKDIAAWRAGYEKQLAGWTENYTSVNEHFGNLIRKSWAKTAYVARVSHFNPAEMLICPPHSALNMGPTQEHRDDYGTGLFEGSSAEPVVDASGAITAINVILQQPRLERLKRSLQARGYQLPVSLEQFAQSALDIVAIHGASVVTTDDGKPTRAYLRPSAGPGVGTWGVSFKPGYFIEASNLTFRWGHYFPDAQRIYEETGANVCITGAQRLFPITGKHASNYGAAASEGNLARAMQYDELIYLAPYVIKNGAIEGGIQSLDALLKYGVLADGPGEEVFGIHKDGNTIIYPPMRVNRLGGTVLRYLIEHMAPALGLQSREGDISFEDIRSGTIVALGYAGNAARITPIGKVDIVKPVSDHEGTVVEQLFDSGIHPVIARIRDQWEGEVRGKLPPSHASLLTPVDLQWGQEFREYLDAFWTKMGFAPLV